MYGSRRFSSITLDHAVQLVDHRIAFVIGLPLVGGEGEVALLAAVVHAELHLGRADRALVRDLEAALGVLGIDVFGFGLGFVPFAVLVGVGLLAFPALVGEAGVVEFEPGDAAGHVEAVFQADAPVGLVDGGQARHVGGDHVVVVVLFLEGNFGHVAVGLDVEAVDADAAGLADVGGVGEIARVVAAVLDFGLVFPADPFFHRRILEAVGALDLGAVAILYVDAGQEATAQGFAAGHRAEGRIHFAVVPAVGADADIAAVELVGVAQDDVDRAGDGVAAAVGAVATQDFDPVDHFRRDPVDPERAVLAGTRHLLAVDQHLGVAAGQAAQLGAVEFHDVGADEADAGHALEHVADGVGLEALEVFQVVDQGGGGVFCAVAVGDLGLHDDRVELSGIRRGAGIGRLVLRGDREAGRQHGHA